MIPCPKLPIFTYGRLKVPHKLLVLAGKIEGAMNGKLPGYKLLEDDKIEITNNKRDEIQGEILWINLEQYDELIQALDCYGQPSKKAQTPFTRFLCEPITNEPVYRGIAPTPIKCWSYKSA
jgi:hypothetical protein